MPVIGIPIERLLGMQQSRLTVHALLAGRVQGRSELTMTLEALLPISSSMLWEQGRST